MPQIYFFTENPKKRDYWCGACSYMLNFGRSFRRTKGESKSLKVKKTSSSLDYSKRMCHSIINANLPQTLNIKFQIRKSTSDVFKLEDVI